MWTWRKEMFQRGDKKLLLRSNSKDLEQFNNRMKIQMINYWCFFISRPNTNATSATRLTWPTSASPTTTNMWSAQEETTAGKRISNWWITHLTNDQNYIKYDAILVWHIMFPELVLKAWSRRSGPGLWRDKWRSALLSCSTCVCFSVFVWKCL